MIQNIKMSCMEKHGLTNVKVIQKENQHFKILRLYGFKCKNAELTVFSILKKRDEVIPMPDYWENLDQITKDP